MNNKMIFDPKYIQFMKKILLLLVALLAINYAALAQPTFIFNSEQPCDGAFCVDVSVKDFTDITGAQFTMQWDPAVYQFVSVGAFGLPGLTVANFDVSDSANGIITFIDWEVAPCTDPNSIGITLPDFSTIFQLCFTAANADYGATSQISITNNPIPIEVFRESTLCNNIGLFVESHLISNCVRPSQPNCQQ